MERELAQALPRHRLLAPTDDRNIVVTIVAAATAVMRLPEMIDRRNLRWIVIAFCRSISHSLLLRTNDALRIGGLHLQSLEPKCHDHRIAISIGTMGRFGPVRASPDT